MQRPEPIDAKRSTRITKTAKRSRGCSRRWCNASTWFVERMQSKAQVLQRTTASGLAIIIRRPFLEVCASHRRVQRDAFGHGLFVEQHSIRVAPGGRSRVDAVRRHAQ